MNSAPFRTRTLNDPTKVFEHNAWDDVEWDEEQEQDARQKVVKNSQDLIADVMREELDTEADKYWDKFYSIHQNRFFKDRNWLFHEFPELLGDEKKSQQCDSSKDANNKDECVASNPEDGVLGTAGKTSSDDTSSVSSPSCSERLQNDEVVSERIAAETSQEQTVSGKTEHNIDVSELNEKSCTDNATQVDLKRTSAEKFQTRQSESDKEICQSSCTEYPGSRSKFRIFEVGCGVGNTVFPVLQTNNDPGVFVYCCDLSSTAIQLVKEHHLYDVNRCHAFVGDLTNPDDQLPFPENSLDFIIMIFVISAIHPDKFQSTFDRMTRCLKPGGMILFRDYGRYDLAQLRFKNGQCLSENFYARQDGTRVYFFTQEELREMFTQAGLTEVQNSIDRRLQVNRRTQQKMYRVWIQCKYKKPQ